MKIPKPKANPNERVLVKNYRRGDVWEEAIVTFLAYRYSWGSWEWSYDVTLIRKSLSGNLLRLYVSNDGIKQIPHKYIKKLKESTKQS